MSQVFIYNYKNKLSVLILFGNGNRQLYGPFYFYHLQFSPVNYLALAY